MRPQLLELGDRTEHVQDLVWAEVANDRDCAARKCQEHALGRRRRQLGHGTRDRRDVRCSEPSISRDSCGDTVGEFCGDRHAGAS
jgi:hypothetical protein